MKKILIAGIVIAIILTIAAVLAATGKLPGMSFSTSTSVSTTPTPGLPPVVVSPPVGSPPATGLPPVVVSPPVVSPPAPPASIPDWVSQRFGFRSKSQTALMIKSNSDKAPTATSFGLVDNCNISGQQPRCIISPIQVRPNVYMIRDNRDKTIGYKIDAAAENKVLKSGKCVSTDPLCLWTITKNAANEFKISPASDPTLALSAIDGINKPPKLVKASSSAAQLWTRSYVV